MAKEKKKKEPSNADTSVALTDTSSFVYDPLEPSYSGLHRAGMVGLALQVEAMKIANQKLPADEVGPIPQIDWTENGRAMKVTFSFQSFEALMRERYLGKVLVVKETKKNRKSNDHESIKNVLVPRLKYLEELGADLQLQEHIRFAYRRSFFSIYKERELFFGVTEDKKTFMERIKTLWKAITCDHASEIQKSSRPNVVGTNLKGGTLLEAGKDALLFHFWPLASWFFTPKALKFDKTQKQIVDATSPPVIVIPDVTDVRSFYEYVKGSFARPFQKHISTSLEASLAFYVAPFVARGQTITEEVLNEFQQIVSGASVFVYLSPGKQPEVAGVFDEAWPEAILEQYIELKNQALRSPAYGAMRVENVLAKRTWHHGFNKLVDQWPLELFVPVKDRKTGVFEMKPKALELAKDIGADFRYFADKEDDMEAGITDSAVSVPTLIDRLVKRYLRWRVFSKGQSPPDEEKVKSALDKEWTDAPLSNDEAALLDEFRDTHAKVVNREFVDFRGATDQKRFAERFIGLFEAGFYTVSEQREMLRPFYEDVEWESGRWLVLMAISAEGARFRKKDPKFGVSTNSKSRQKTNPKKGRNIQ